MRLAYTVHEIADILPISPATVYKLIKTKGLPARTLANKTVVLHSDLVIFLNAIPLYETDD